jgi:hypothetical protein
VFIQNQLDVLSDTIISSVQEHAQLSQELEQLQGERATIPPVIAQMIESTIVPRSVERSRQQRRLSVLVAILLALVFFPHASDYTVYVLSRVMGDQLYPFGPTNTIGYLVGLGVSTLIMFTLTGRRFTNVVRENRVPAALAAALLLLLWAAGVVYIALNLVGRSYASTLDPDIVASISIILFAGGVRISYLLLKGMRGLLARVET